MDTTENNLIYHYTSFEKFKCILKYGTLRFKESTESNDMFDTKSLVTAIQKMDFYKSKENPFIEIINFALRFYKSEAYTPLGKSLVCCFSAIPDSRLLWDAYTMHRPSSEKCIYGKDSFCSNVNKYNGLCIAFKKEKIKDLVNDFVDYGFDSFYFDKIYYGEQYVKLKLNEMLKSMSMKSFILSKDEDQKQNIIPPIEIPLFTKSIQFEIRKALVYPVLSFMGEIEKLSSFFKHEFWKEEKEFRAAIWIHNNNIQKCQNIKEDGFLYCDIPIQSSDIDHIITGPEFSIKEINEIMETNSKISFNKIKKIPSLGTGIIRNK